MRRAAILLLLSALVACSGSEQEALGRRPELIAVPEPDLSAAEKGVQEQIRDQRSALEAALAEPTTPNADLASLCGDLGLIYVIYDYIEAASACFENARRLLPEDFRWHYLYGYLGRRQGRVADAVTGFGRALELNPEFVPAMIRLGRSRSDQGALAEAGELFARALELDATSAAAYEGLGKVAQEQGDSTRAVECFTKALELQPEASSLHYALGQVYRKLGDREQARQHLQLSGDVAVRIADPVLSPLAGLAGGAQFYVTQAAEALVDERFADAVEFYRQAVEHDPADFTIYKGYCYAFEKIGDLEAAIGQLRAALEHGATGDAQRDQLERAEIYRIMGGLQVLYGRDGEAIESFTRSLELSPSMLDSRVKLGNALARNRRFGEAIEHFDQLLAERPDHVAILSKRATALVNLGRGEEAIREFRRAIANDPENAELRLRFAAALEFLGQPRAGAAERARAAEISDRAGDVREQVRLMAQTARRHANQGEYETAVSSYREALRLAPENAEEAVDMRYRLAVALNQLGRYDEALAEYRRVIEVGPRYAPARRGEIAILILLGRFGEARVKLNDALRLFPRDRQLAHTQARLLATVPDPRVRDGKLALAVAQRLRLEYEGDPRVRETLAMAFAERGFFPQALGIQRRLIADAQSAGRSDLLPQLEAELAAYERGEAWTFSSPEELLAVTMKGPVVR